MFTDFCIRLYVGLQSGLKTAAERAKETDGAGAAEYLLVLGIISVVVAALFWGSIRQGIDNLGGNIKDLLDGTGNSVKTAPTK